MARASGSLLNILLVVLAIPLQPFAVRVRHDHADDSDSRHPITVPKWMFDMKDNIIAAITDDSWQGYSPMSNSAVKIVIDHMEPLSIDASTYDLRAQHGKVLVDFTDLRMKLRIHLEKVELFGHIPLLSADVLGGTYIDADVQGGLTAGFLLDPDSATWQPVCADDGSLGDEPPLHVTPTLHLNPLYDRLDILAPYIEPIIRYMVCYEVKYKMKTKRDMFKDKFKDFMHKHGIVHKLLKRTRLFEELHLEEDCWMYGCRGGPCNYCGIGYCCRQGWFAGGCDGSSGDPDKHVCVPAPTVLKAALNLGKECWNAGHCRNGRCGYCGSGLCCRSGVAGGECSGEVGGKREHQCIEA